MDDTQKPVSPIVEAVEAYKAAREQYRTIRTEQNQSVLLVNIQIHARALANLILDAYERGELDEKFSDSPKDTADER